MAAVRAVDIPLIKARLIGVAVAAAVQVTTVVQGAVEVIRGVPEVVVLVAVVVGELRPAVPVVGVGQTGVTVVLLVGQIHGQVARAAAQALTS